MPISTSEIAWLPALLDPIPLTGVVVTADALHTTRDHARALTCQGAHYVFTVKGQPAPPLRPPQAPVLGAGSVSHQ